jgi:hypothetical protein
MSDEHQRGRGDFEVAIYHAARRYVEIANPPIVGSAIEVTLPMSSIPSKLATAVVGDRIRIRLNGTDAQTSPMLWAVIEEKARQLESFRLTLGIQEWDKLARYWRARFEAAGKHI